MLSIVDSPNAKYLSLSVLLVWRCCSYIALKFGWRLFVFILIIMIARKTQVGIRCDCYSNKDPYL